MKRQCFGVKKNIISCARDVSKFIGHGLKAKGYCGGAECFDAITADAVAKTKADRERSERKQHAEDKRNLKESTIREQKPLAQKAFNQYVRALRLSQGDKHCISCGRHHSEIEDKGFGKFDCGHFLSVGARPELRFTIENAYLQCKSCNGGSGKYAKKAETVGLQYEARLREKVGDELVDWLKGPHEVPRWRAADYVEFKKKFTAMKKEIMDKNS